MLIDRIDLFHVAMPLREPWRTAASDETAIESVLVRMTSGGLAGWGETAPHSGPNYCEEWAGGAFLVLQKKLAPAIAGQTLTSGEDLQALLKSVKGNTFAKAGLDLAFHDLLARSQDRPLWRLLGGARPDVLVGEDISVEPTLDQLVAKIGKAVEKGLARVKLKFRPGWGVDMVAAVRSAYPDLLMHIDCNSAFTLDDLEMFRALDRYDLAMIEQPLRHDDILDHAVLRRKIATPICLDETITSVERARQAIEQEACDIINLKLGRLGGITPTLRVREMCKAAGVGNWMGSMLESAVAQNATIAFATLPNMTYPADVFPTEKFYEEDLANRDVTYSAPSYVTATERPGIGVEPDPAKLKRFTVNEAVIR
ncbi:o-succinylbenzoate synthase [Roseibium aggregatum]|uniref:o-succinylbenzoate synthase n=1 Tax=Roseibium aggregatum TaxID=187304 RepID=A0A939EFE0_9HYPH|nr:o-succinylbenzoate synthase [Roseibium aggregatum]MBN9672155.1 o-succinylbenzoate synthase [Roseibium aggregatum]